MIKRGGENARFSVCVAVTGSSSRAPFLSLTRGKQLRRAAPASRETHATARRASARGTRLRRAEPATSRQSAARDGAGARCTARLDGSRLTSAALSTNEGARHGDVSRFAVANFERRGGPTGTRLPAAVTRFPPLARSFLLSFSLALSTPSISSSYSRTRALPPSVSLARTYTLSRYSARLPQIFISGSTANSGRTGRSARDRPGFLTVLTASSPQAATAAAAAIAVVHRRTYARLCAPGQHPSVGVAEETTRV